MALNASTSATWLYLAAPEQIEAVLLEELGHAIDNRLNGHIDTRGDEGSVFSALIRDAAIPAGESTQNDHLALIINGQSIAVEAAGPLLDPSANPILATIDVDSGAPSGAVGILVSSLIDSGGTSITSATPTEMRPPSLALTPPQSKSLRLRRCHQPHHRLCRRRCRRNLRQDHSPT